jgi:hypothetical protein
MCEKIQKKTAPLDRRHPITTTTIIICVSSSNIRTALFTNLIQLYGGLFHEVEGHYYPIPEMEKYLREMWHLARARTSPLLLPPHGRSS